LGSAALAWIWRSAPQRGGLALALASLAGWLVLTGVPQSIHDLPKRGWPVVVALGVAAVPQSWRTRAGVVGALTVVVVPLWIWLGNRGLALGAVWWAVMATSVALAGWGLTKGSGRGGGGVVAIAAWTGAVLIGLTGSQSLATEAAVFAAATLPWARRPTVPGWTVAVLLGASLWTALHLSYLGWAGLVPLGVLACLPLNRLRSKHAGAIAVTAAAAVAAAGSAPVVVDWVLNPPF
jgi:hypothetical protein